LIEIKTSIQMFSPHAKLIATTVLILLSGCNEMDKQKTASLVESECTSIRAQIAGLDQEIKLRLSEKFEIEGELAQQRRIGPELYRRMIELREKVIQARSRRVEIEQMAHSKPKPCTVPEDDTETTDKYYRCLLDETERTHSLSEKAIQSCLQRAFPEK
jgi:hypothetical protein